MLNPPPPNTEMNQRSRTRLFGKQLDYSHELEKINRENGWLGKIFGSSPNVPTYIVGAVSTVLVFTLGVYTFFPKENTPPTELWNILIPVLTTILGYIFGSNSNRGN
jgi:hypothetical protein